MNPKVFVVQNSGLYDLSPAKQFGELVHLAPPVITIESESARRAALEKFTALLDGYDFECGDSILCLGNPVLIGYAVALAADADPSDMGRVRCLQWDRHTKSYISVEDHLWGP